MQPKDISEATVRMKAAQLFFYIKAFFGPKLEGRHTIRSIINM